MQKYTDNKSNNYLVCYEDGEHYIYQTIENNLILRAKIGALRGSSAQHVFSKYEEKLKTKEMKRFKYWGDPKFIEEP